MQTAYVGSLVTILILHEVFQISSYLIRPPSCEEEGLMIINPFPAPFPFKKGGLNTQSPRACYSQHKYLSPVFGLRLVLSQLSRVSELNKKVWESEYYWSKAYIVSVAREGHGSPHVNRLADVTSH